MRCYNCNKEIRDDAVFCPACGKKVLKNDEEKINKVIEDIDNKDNLKDKSDENIIEKCNYNKENKKKNRIKIYLKKLKKKKIYICIFMIIFIIIFLVLVPKLISNRNIAISSNKGIDTIKSSNLKKLNILNKEYNIAPGQVEIIKYYVSPIDTKTSELKWESSNKNIRVNSKGYISSNKPNEEGIITVSSLDGSIKSQCKVRVITNKKAFLNTMDYIKNKDMEKQNEVNLSEDKFKLGSRYTEDKRKVAIDLFTKTNKEISSYKIIQKQFVNSKTKNTIDCDVYLEPNTGDIRKIVTIEYLSKNLQITDYYYMEGNIYFVFRRNEKYYRPIPAQQDFPGSRYYYYEDSLLRWRKIETKSNNTFEKTDYYYNNKNFQWKTYEYKNLDDVEKEKNNYVKASENPKLRVKFEKEFVNREKSMLDAAYNIYNKVVKSPRTTNLTGYVLNNLGEPMSGATIKVFSKEYNLLAGKTITDDNGLYKLSVPVDTSMYTIYISKPGYVKTNICEVVPSLETSKLVQENVYMYPKSNVKYNVRLNLVNALNGNNLNGNEIQGTYIVIRKGINNKKGSIERRIELDNINDSYNPLYNIQLLPGNYTAEVISPGRENSYFTIATLVDNMEIYSNIVPKIEDESVKIVLSWGENPSDLDSHLFLPSNKQIAYYSTETDNCYLDVDDTNSYGPETITLNKLERGTYKYYVADFTNCSADNYSSMDMSTSFAKVDVYTKNGLISTFTVPSNRSGVIWHVFNISNGKIVPVQRYFDNIEDMEWWTTGKYN